MKVFTRLFANLFTNATSEENDRHAMYRAWQRERESAARFGASHVQEIDAIFTRAGL